MCKNYKITLIALISILFMSTAKAQDKPDSIHSSILGDLRRFKVLLPQGYKPGSKEKYDVLYVLDGNWNADLVAMVQHFSEDQGLIPPSIIVSVMEPDRNADLAPTHLDTWKHSGGADKFLAFIKNELVPYINKQYPSNGDNGIWGHSLSGMFVLYALVKEPTLFKSYIALDPSVWWDNNYVIKMAAAKLPTLPLEDATFFIAGRESDMSEMKIDTLEIVLKKAAPPGLKWKLNVYQGETHGSVGLKGAYDGLRHAYQGYNNNMVFSPMNGIVLKGKPFKLFYANETANMHYTVDGTVPTINSPAVKPEIVISGPAKVTYKVLTNRSRYNISTTGLFTDEKMAKPLSNAKNLRSGGFNYAYYEGTWDQWPDLSKLKPVKTGVTNAGFDPDKLPLKNHYALTIDGLLESREEGYYVFGIGRDIGKLYIDNKLVIKCDGDYKTCIVPLSKGFYPFRIEYLQQHEENRLDWLQYLTPSIMDSQNVINIPPNLQFGRK